MPTSTKYSLRPSRGDFLRPKFMCLPSKLCCATCQKVALDAATSAHLSLQCDRLESCWQCHDMYSLQHFTRFCDSSSQFDAACYCFENHVPQSRQQHPSDMSFACMSVCLICHAACVVGKKCGSLGLRKSLCSSALVAQPDTSA